MTQKNINQDTTNKKIRQKIVKRNTETVMPQGVVIQVHERPIPPENYKICNGTTFGTYQPKTWGR